MEGEITQILNSEEQTHDRLNQAFDAVYRELRMLAGRVLSRSGREGTLSPTVLVHETYARLIGSEQLNINGRRHFFALCGRVMRQIITDHARARLTEKRGGGQVVLPLTESGVIDASRPESVAALDEALSWLEKHDERLVELLQLRIYAGLELPEIAPLMDLSVRQLQREWTRAHVWLSEALTQHAAQ